MSEEYKNYDLNSYKSEPGKKVKYKKAKHKNKVLRAIVFSFIAIVLAAIIGVFAYSFGLLNSVKIDNDFEEEAVKNIEKIDEKIVNIALFGVDSRQVNNFDGLSDSIMILSINTKDNTVRLISVMRDSLAPIEGHGKGKLNSAYAVGGPELAVKTLNKLFGLDITDYATVNFYGMSDIIDAVGGIDVTITEDELKNKTRGINAMIDEQCGYLNYDLSDYIITKTGYQHLNGLQAVAYSRIRYGKNSMGTNDDFGRTDRQRLVMKLLMDKALTMNPVSHPKLVTKLIPYVKTSLSKKEMLSLATVLMKRPSFEQARVPMEEYIINADFRGTGASTVYYSYAYASKVLKAFIYDCVSPEDYIKENGVELTEWF